MICPVCGKRYSLKIKIQLLTLLDNKKINLYHVIGTATLDKIRKGEGHIDTRSIENLCKYPDCQPEDIMAYIPEDKPKP